MVDDFRRYVDRYADDVGEAEALAESVRARLAWRRRRGRKRCSSCGVDRAPGEFGADRSRADGLDVRCRECRHVRR